MNTPRHTRFAIGFLFALLLALAVSPLSAQPIPLPDAPANSTNLLRNRGFESGLTGSWTVKSAGAVAGDRRICKAAAAQAGNCYFNFRNGAGENTRLTQNVPARNIDFSEGDGLLFTGYVYSAAAASRVQARLLVTYADGATQSEFVDIDGVTDDGAGGVAYAYFEVSLQLDASNVRNIRASIVNRGSAGAARIDSLYLEHETRQTAFEVDFVFCEPAVNDLASYTFEVANAPVGTFIIEMIAGNTPDRVFYNGASSITFIADPGVFYALAVARDSEDNVLAEAEILPYSEACG